MKYRVFMGKIEKLKVWQREVELAISVYKIVKETVSSRDFGLKDQMQRSSVSTSSNIAEGDVLDTERQSIKHFFIAKGSRASLSPSENKASNPIAQTLNLLN